MPPPGTKIVAEIEHECELDGHHLTVTEIHWNLISGLSFDVTIWEGDENHLLTGAESFDDWPTDDELRALIAEHHSRNG